MTFGEFLSNWHRANSPSYLKTRKSVRIPKLKLQRKVWPSEPFRRLWPARSNFTPASQSVATIRHGRTCLPPPSTSRTRVALCGVPQWCVLLSNRCRLYRPVRTINLKFLKVLQLLGRRKKLVSDLCQENRGAIILTYGTK